MNLRTVIEKILLYLQNIKYVWVQKRKEKIILKNQIEYFEKLNQEYNEIRNFKHDYYNILYTISAYIQDKDMVALEKFFCEKIVKIDNINKGRLLYIGSLSNLKITEIRGMLLSKILLAEKKGVLIKISIPEEVNNIWGVNSILITRCLGNLIDNAIEAALECDNPNVNFILIKNSNSIRYVINNNFKNKIDDIEELYLKGKSSKNENRGLGLYIVKKLLRSERQVLLESTIKDDMFIQELNIVSPMIFKSLALKKCL